MSSDENAARLAALQARLRLFEASRDPTVLLDHDTLRTAQALWVAALAKAGQPELVGTQVVAVLGLYHWYRIDAVLSVGRSNERTIATEFFCLLLNKAPGLIPAQAWQGVRQAVANKINQAAALSDAAVELYRELADRGEPALLDKAMHNLRRAVEISRGTPAHPLFVLSLAAGFHDRFTRRGDRGDLDSAISAMQTVVRDTTAATLVRPDHLDQLSQFLMDRFELAGDKDDLDEAIAVLQTVVADVTSTAHVHASRLSNLDNALRARFELLGNLDDIDLAVSVGQKAVAAKPTDDSDRPRRLTNLANSLRIQAQARGSRSDLDKAVSTADEAVTAARSGHPGRPRAQATLGNCLHARYVSFGDTTGMDVAIAAMREAVNLTPVGELDRIGYLLNLGNILRSRYELTMDVADLDAAVVSARSAAETAEPTFPYRAAMFSNLGGVLARRFDLTGQPADLADAIEAFHQAVDTADTAHPDRPTFLSNLGTSLLTSYERSGDDAELDEAIDAARTAVALTPEGHPAVAHHRSTLARSLYARFLRFEDTADLDAAIAQWTRASAAVTSGAPARLSAAQRWAEAAHRAHRLNQALDGYRVAIGLLNEVAWHGFDRRTRERQLTPWSSLASAAAACAIRAQRPDLAVELLEQGRTVVWNQALRLRADLDRLADLDPDLAKRLDDVRSRLDRTTFLSTVGVDAPAEPSRLTAGAGRALVATHLARRRELAREWDLLLAEVRSLPDFERFLQPLQYPDLAGAAEAGPVVVLTLDSDHGHALIVTADGPSPAIVELPMLKFDELARNVIAWVGVLARADTPGRTLLDRERDRHTALDVLEWMWNAVAWPVLQRLGHPDTPPQDGPRQRIWWCPTGPLAILPVHAAGRHPRLATSVARDLVLDRVISSYTPTLASLVRAREDHDVHLTGRLVVAMPETPDFPPLPGTVDELAVIHRHRPPGDSQLVLVGKEATRQAVLDALNENTMVHLACHATQRLADPATSALQLSDGPLTVADVSSQGSRSRQLAFLSACETAVSDPRLPDEAMHLASSMHFLGYRHVIATMWRIADSHAPDVTEAVYTALLENGAIDFKRTAAALRDALVRLRNVDPTNPLPWAAYMHIGA